MILPSIDASDRLYRRIGLLLPFIPLTELKPASDSSHHSMVNHCNGPSNVEIGSNSEAK